MIDGQHKELIEKINQLLAPVRMGTEKLRQYRHWHILQNIREFHLDEEEKLQEEIAYPGIKEHKKSMKNYGKQ